MSGHLEFFYHFEKKEFVLRFENDHEAKAYQTWNSEARILRDQPYEVWLPVPPEMAGLRSSTFGMVIVFNSNEAAMEWQKQTPLTTITNYDKNTAMGVSFQRSWPKDHLSRNISSLSSTIVPYAQPQHPRSSTAGYHHQPFVKPDVMVERTRGSGGLK